MLDPRRLTLLQAVVEGGSMSEAALELGYSTAAVSQQVAALERQVGAPLLVRHARGVRPTAAGALLARHAGGLSERLRAAERELADLLAAEGGTVRAGLFASATVGALPAALGRFRERHPGVRVTVSEYEVAEAADRLRAGELDLATLFDDPDRPSLDRSGLELASLGFDAMHAVLPAGHPLADRSSVPLAGLREEPWILARGAACADLVLHRCREVGFEPQVALTTDDYAAARSLVAAGMGVAAVPCLMRQRDGDGVVVRPLEPAPRREVFAALPAGGVAPPAAAALREAFEATRASWA